MANYENIRPYSEFAHEAALHGGVEKYLDIIAESNRKLGIAQERGTEGWKGFLLLGIGIAVWEGGKGIYRCIKNAYLRKRHERLAVLQKQSDDAKAAIRETLYLTNTISQNE